MVKGYKSVVILQMEKYLCIFIIIKNAKESQPTSLEEGLNYLSIPSIENDIINSVMRKSHQNSMQKKSMIDKRQVAR